MPGVWGALGGGGWRPASSQPAIFSEYFDTYRRYLYRSYMQRVPNFMPENVRELLQLTDKIYCVQFKEPPNYNCHADTGCEGWELWHRDEPAEPIRILSPSSYDEFASVIKTLLNT